jgi:hypothetical protein
MLVGSWEDSPLLRPPLSAAALRAANHDFWASLAEDSRAGEIQVRLHGAGSGPLAANHGRIKRRYSVGAAR